MSNQRCPWFRRVLVAGAAIVGLAGLPAKAQQVTDPSPAQAATDLSLPLQSRLLFAAKMESAYARKR